MENINENGITSVKTIVASFNKMLNEQESLTYDLNTGFYPVTYRRNLSVQEQQKTYKAEIVTSNKNELIYTEITTQSDDGPLTAQQDDVATVLMSLYETQIRTYPNRIGTNDEDKVLYTDSMICDLLGVTTDSKTAIRRSIQKLLKLNVNVSEKKFKSGKASDSGVSRRTLKDGTFLMVQGTQVVSENVGGKTGYKQYKWVQFHPYVAERIRENIVANVNLEIYKKLNSGPKRKIYRFLQSKKGLFGNQFTFDLAELLQVLSKQNAKRPFSEVKKHLLDLQKMMPEFEFWSEKKNNNGNTVYIIGVEFKNLLLLEEQESNSFIDNIFAYYGQEVLETEYDLYEKEILNKICEITRTFRKKTGQEVFNYHGREINIGEFVVDLTLWQVEEAEYPCDSFWGLARSIMNNFISEDYRFPQGYNDFVDERVRKRMIEKDRQIREEIILNQERKEQKLKETQQENIDSHFKVFYKDIYSNDKKLQDKVHKAMRVELEESGEFSDDFQISIIIQRDHEEWIKKNLNKVMDWVTKVNKPVDAYEAYKENRAKLESGITIQPSLPLS